MTGMALGYTHFKFFPAEASGGVDARKAFSGPLADIRFCPTGGITPSSYKDYLALKMSIVLVAAGLRQRMQWNTAIGIVSLKLL